MLMPLVLVIDFRFSLSRGCQNARNQDWLLAVGCTVPVYLVRREKSIEKKGQPSQKPAFKQKGSLKMIESASDSDWQKK